MSEEHKLLIIGDDPTFQYLIQSTLQNYQMLTASTGEEALEILEGYHPDLILIDIYMPGIDGYKICQIIRAKAEYEFTPIICISASETQEDCLNAFSAGADDYILKPLKPKGMKLKIKSILKKKSYFDKLREDNGLSNQMISSMMKSTNQNQIIFDFTRCSLFVNSEHELICLFFKSLNKLGINGVLHFKEKREDGYHSTSGEVTEMDAKILSVAKQKSDKVLRFGDDRAIYKWKKIDVLVRNLGGKSDTVSILIDAFEEALELFATSEKLLTKIKTIKAHNDLITDKIFDTTNNTKQELYQLFEDMGLNVNFSEDEKDKLDDFIAAHQNNIQVLLSNLSDNDLSAISLVQQLRSPPQSVKEMLKNTDEEADIF